MSEDLKYSHVGRPPGASVEWRVSRRDGTPLAVEGNGHGKVFVKQLKRTGRTAWEVWRASFAAQDCFAAFEIRVVKA